MDRVELGSFLRRRREQLHPATLGLRAGGRRRTPGLRRDEVARLAEVSSNYYERIEQGRGPTPSAAVLAGIARALRLTGDERDYVYLLAGHAPPQAVTGDGVLDNGLAHLLEALAPTVPAFVVDDLSTVLVQNPLGIALLGPLATADGRDGTVVWRWFTDPAWRSIYVADQHEQLGREYVADLRGAVARRRGDPAARRLVTDLCAASAEFSAVWERGEVAVKRSQRKSLLHPVLGRLDLDCDIVDSPSSGQHLVLFRAPAGSPTAACLAQLAELPPRHGRIARAPDTAFVRAGRVAQADVPGFPAGTGSRRGGGEPR